jgi:hypothetical protein
MSAKMEEYLDRKRSELDVETPDDDAIWNGIKRGLHSPKRGDRGYITGTTFIRFRNIAATVIILFSLGYIANDIINGRLARGKVTLSSIDSRLGEREREYKTLVGFKTNEVKAFAASDDVIIRQLFEEIKKLDLIYDQAMADLKELGPDEKVINTIFSTYEQRIRLLELIILETNKINSHENNEKTIL